MNRLISMREFNYDQIAASDPSGGVSLVLAGAGTGKTSTMILKIRNILEHSIARPEEILVLTFSRKAAGEIRERLNHVPDADITPGFAGTFHSFSLKLLSDFKEFYLENCGLSAFPSIIGEDEKYRIMKKLVMENPGRFLGLPADIVIKLSGNFSCLNRKVISKLKSGPLYDEISRIILQYDEYKKINRFIEFDDMVNHAADMLESYPLLKKSINEKYRFIFVDEFQDTSENNLRLLLLLLPEQNRNLFMVGDDFQSIYKFRNSRIEYIINAEKFFPGLSIHKLTTNYRSKKEIIAVSNRFIKLNKFRTSKKIRSHEGKGGIVKYHPAADKYSETEILNRIIDSTKGCFSIAVLYRNNYQGDFLKQKVINACNKKVVEFMTMHSSKGLEFDVVIITGISDKIIPDRTTDIEEERRLFYVALTRAKNELHLLYQPEEKNKLPRFIRETGYRK